MLKALGVGGVLVFVLLIIIFGPLLTIWALNTLFTSLNIAYGFAEWLAIILLGMAIRGNVTVNK